MLFRSVLDELTLQAPLWLPAQGAVQVQVMVHGADQSGHREVSIHSRRQGSDVFTCHGTGVLSPAGDRPAVPAGPPGAWPPAGAVPIDLAGAYDRLAGQGYAYGPAFRGLQAAWRNGEELCAEVRLPDGADADRFGIHPALLDAALPPLLLATAAGAQPDGGQLRLPFSWAGGRLNAVGATFLRVRISPAGPDTVALTLTDTAGTVVITIDGLTTRGVSPADLAGTDDGGARRCLLRLGWPAVPAPAPPRTGAWAILGTGRTAVTAAPDGAGLPVFADLPALHDGAGDAGPDAVFTTLTDGLAHDAAKTTHAAVHAGLELIRNWLADDRLGSARLVIVTHGAVVTHSGEELHDLAGAAIWGLTRSAQTENPGRLVLLDLGSAEPSPEAIAAALATGEPQLALRDGRVHTPRLARLPDQGGTLVPPAASWRLDVAERGSLENSPESVEVWVNELTQRFAQRPKVDDVRIGACAATRGLRFAKADCQSAA